jgi:hypothetical protein
MKKVNIHIVLLAAGCWLFTSCDQDPILKDPIPVKDTLLLGDTISAGAASLHIIRIDSLEYANVADPGSWSGSAAIEKQNLEKDASIISCKKNVYTVRLLNHDSLVLKDDSSETQVEEFVDYTYFGRLGATPFIVFERALYEGLDYLVVDLKDGSRTILWGEPVLSPGEKYIFCTQYDLDAGMLMNGMQLFTPDSVNLKLAWEKQPELWGPVNPKWSGDTVIYFMQESPNRHIGKELFFYAKVRVN